MAAFQFQVLGTENIVAAEEGFSHRLGFSSALAQPCQTVLSSG